MQRYALLLSMVSLVDPAAGQVEKSECEPSPHGVIVMVGISRDEVTLDYQGDTLLLRNGEDSLSLFGFDARDPYADLGRFDFGAPLCTRELIDGGFDLGGIDDGEIVLGTNAPDRIRGARGNDTLQGRDGDDVYFYELGDGVDCIADAEGATTIVFGTGIAPENVVVALDDGGGLYVRLLDRDGTVSAQGMNVRAGADASFRFHDGATRAAADFAPIGAAVLRRALRRREHSCHWEVADAARAGLVDWRAELPEPPALPPTPQGPIAPRSGRLPVMTADGRLEEVELRCRDCQEEPSVETPLTAPDR